MKRTESPLHLLTPRPVAIFGLLLLVAFTVETLVMALLPHLFADTAGLPVMLADALLLTLLSVRFRSFSTEATRVTSCMTMLSVISCSKRAGSV